MKDKGIVKISMNLPAELLAKLKATAESEGRTFTDVFRRALEMELFLNEEESAGAKILIEKSDGKMVQIFRFRAQH